MTFAGLDIGTTGCKFSVFSRDGKYLDKAYRDYPVSRSHSGHEVDAEQIAESVFDVISQMADKYKDIAALGITSFGETFVMTDTDGTPLTPSLLYTDPRGADECKQLCERLGEKKIAAITGLRPHEMYGISKMMWIKAHKPEIYDECAYIFQISDYIAFMLTGERMIDYSLATRSMAFDIEKFEWSDEIFAAAGIDMTKLSKPVPTGKCVGTLTPKAAEKCGLSADVKVVLAGQDQVAAAIGAGVFEPSLAVDGAGTVQCVTPVFDGRPDMETMFNGYFCLVPYLETGRYVTYAFSYTGGALIGWCTQTLAKKEAELAEIEGISINEYLERAYKLKNGDVSAPTGIMVLPYFAGAATPYMDTQATGVVTGLKLDTGAEDIYMACMEGIAYEMRLNMEALGESGKSIRTLHATGGGAKSEVWMQMKADILNLPITVLQTVEAGTVGCAMLAAIGAGEYSSLDEAAENFVEVEKTFVPRADAHEKYSKVYENYKKLYTVVRPLI